ncbi:hypothetical protein ACJRO7_021188 [Eucalyptus globulus]|uniref:Uncharacterized protein n=1 Tax=Eucalyptus globulus TaxID=34317 RepID=A0ABD3KKV8_EUCGL
MVKEGATPVKDLLASLCCWVEGRQPSVRRNVSDRRAAVGSWVATVMVNIDFGVSSRAEAQASCKSQFTGAGSGSGGAVWIIVSGCWSSAPNSVNAASVTGEQQSCCRCRGQGRRCRASVVGGSRRRHRHRGAVVCR